MATSSNASRRSIRRPASRGKKANRLEQELAGGPLEYPVEAGAAGISDFRKSLENEDTLVSRALSSTLQSEAGIEVGRDLDLGVESLGTDGDYRITTNVTATFGLDEAEAHHIVERALVCLAGLKQRLHLMQEFNTLTGFREEEAPIFEDSLAFLAEHLDPDAQERRFDRVVAIAGLPSLEGLPEDEHVDVEQLLELPRNHRVSRR